MSEPVYRTVVMAARGLTAIRRWKLIINGGENVPATGPAVLAVNHAGYLDFVFAAWASTLEQNRLVRYMAKKEVFEHKISGPLMRAMKHIPVDRSGDPARSLDHAIKALEQGEIVGTFPEATINRSFVPQRGKTGAVRMAQAASAPIVPVAVWGAHRIMTKGRPRNFQRGVAIQVEIGEQMTVDPTEDPRLATDRMMDRIRALLEKAQRTYPQTPSGPEDMWWMPAHLGGTAPTPEEVKPRQGEAGLQ
ncbi:MAG TPA: lysophospholipid acyltransferase family protein [Actinomycetota bacterium]|nr:lysophospholipid acyltransferase family protein [Actinomycetota bacterium]